jgi:hypothetical protein
MINYSITVLKRDTTLHSLEKVPLERPADAWGLIQKLANQFHGAGLRVVVKDEDGDVVIMAGLAGSSHQNEQLAT